MKLFGGWGPPKKPPRFSKKSPKPENSHFKLQPQRGFSNHEANINIEKLMSTSSPKFPRNRKQVSQKFQPFPFISQACHQITPSISRQFPQRSTKFGGRALQ